MVLISRTCAQNSSTYIVSIKCLVKVIQVNENYIKYYENSTDGCFNNAFLMIINDFLVVSKLARIH